ncbi:MAG: SDR family oxidoreductase [Steroidobacteraceae bacterium]
MAKRYGMDGRVAFITGAGGGIGRATALSFAREGARVAVNDVMEEGGRETVELIQHAGGEAMFVGGSVASEKAVESMIGTVVTTWGRLDFADNNAWDAVFLPLIDMTEGQWDNAFDVCLKGVWLCMKHELKQMTRQGSGSIVNIASIAGIQPEPFTGAYSVAKAGVIQLTRVAAGEYGGSKGIRCNAIAPGFIGSERAVHAVTQEFITPEASAAALARVKSSPAGRWGTTEELAESVVWLSSENASFINGAVLAVDGGMLCV